MGGGWQDGSLGGSSSGIPPGESLEGRSGLEASGGSPSGTGRRPGGGAGPRPGGKLGLGDPRGNPGLGGPLGRGGSGAPGRNQALGLREDDPGRAAGTAQGCRTPRPQEGSGMAPGGDQLLGRGSGTTLGDAGPSRPGGPGHPGGGRISPWWGRIWDHLREISPGVAGASPGAGCGITRGWMRGVQIPPAWDRRSPGAG